MMTQTRDQRMAKSRAARNRRKETKTVVFERTVNLYRKMRKLRKRK